MKTYKQKAREAEHAKAVAEGKAAKYAQLLRLLAQEFPDTREVIEDSLRPKYREFVSWTGQVLHVRIG